MQKTPLYTAAYSIVKRIQDSGAEALFAGGAVRDMLLKTPLHDIDIATSLRPEEVQALFKHTIPVGIAFGVVVVVLDGMNFEVATFRNDGAYIDGRHPTSVSFSTRKEDAQRRDFTINALFFDPVRSIVFDDVGGQDDLSNGIIRAVGNASNRFQEDALRLMRACRFAARFHFRIETETAKAMRVHAGNIEKVSPERIGDELKKTLLTPHPDTGLTLLNTSGILHHILPELVAMQGVEQPNEYHPEGDVWVHTIKLLGLLSTFPTSVELALACLFHDIGKPATQVFADRIRFNNHETIGAQITERIFRRLKYSNKEREAVVHLVQTHLHFIPVQQMRIATLKKFIWQNNFETMMQLHWIDCMASHEDLSCYDFCREKQHEFGEEKECFAPLLQGRDLIALGLKPGRAFTPLLHAAQELQLEGGLKTKEGAQIWAKKEIAKLKQGN